MISQDILTLAKLLITNLPFKTICAGLEINPSLKEDAALTARRHRALYGKIDHTCYGKVNHAWFTHEQHGVRDSYFDSLKKQLITLHERALLEKRMQRKTASKARRPKEPEDVIILD